MERNLIFGDAVFPISFVGNSLSWRDPVTDEVDASVRNQAGCVDFDFEIRDVRQDMKDCAIVVGSSTAILMEYIGPPLVFSFWPTPVAEIP